MFAVNLRNYVHRNSKRRLRDDRISLIIAFAFCILMIALGQPERSVAIEGLIVLGLCMLSFTLYFCSNAPQIAASLQSESTRGILYHPVTRRLAWISAAVLLALFPLPEVEATVLDRRLRKLIQRVPLDRESIDKVTQTMKEAATYDIRVAAPTTSAVEATLRITAEIAPHLSEDAIKAASAAASTSTINIGAPPDIHGPLYASLPEAKGSTWVFIPIAANTGPDNYATIGVARRPDVAEMEGIDNRASVESEYGPAVLVVKGLTATIDGWRLKHVVFQDMNLSYRGGPLILESVYFLSCHLECNARPNSWKLLSAVTNGGWITLSLGA